MKRLAACLLLGMLIFCQTAVGLAADQNTDSNDQIIAVMTKVLETDARDSVAYLKRGNAYLIKLQYDSAISDFNKAIELNPKYAAAYLDRGWIYQRQGQYDLAIKDFDAAIKIDPQYAKPYLNKGQAYEEQRLYQKAIDTYRNFIANASPQDSQDIENARNCIRVLGGTI